MEVYYVGFVIENDTIVTKMRSIKKDVCQDYGGGVVVDIDSITQITNPPSLKEILLEDPNLIYCFNSDHFDLLVNSID